MMNSLLKTQRVSQSTTLTGPRTPYTLLRCQYRSFGIAPDFDPNKDYYKILGVPPSANEKDVKAAFYKLAKEYHPDRTGGKTTEKFKEISNAYNVLGTKEKRQQYDTQRAYAKQESTSSSGQQAGQGFGGY